MKNKLTLSQYVQSKKQLVEAVKSNPMINHVYEVNKYCKMPVGVSDNLKEYINLKPKTQLTITWHYSYNGKCEYLHEMARKPVKVVVVDKKTLQQYELFQTDERLTKWIQTNAKMISG